MEVHEGKEGFKYWLNLILKEKQDVYGIGIEDDKFDEAHHYELENFFRKEAIHGTKEKVLAKKGSNFTYNYSHIEYRYLKEEFFSPMGVIIFSNYVTIQSFENDATIIIKSKILAESYKKHFEQLWKIADKED